MESQDRVIRVEEVAQAFALLAIDQRLRRGSPAIRSLPSPHETVYIGTRAARIERRNLWTAQAIDGNQFSSALSQEAQGCLRRRQQFGRGVRAQSGQTSKGVAAGAEIETKAHKGKSAAGDEQRKRERAQTTTIAGAESPD